MMVHEVVEAWSIVKYLEKRSRSHQGKLKADQTNYVCLRRWEHMGAVKRHAPADARVPELHCLSHAGS